MDENLTYHLRLILQLGCQLDELLNAPVGRIIEGSIELHRELVQIVRHAGAVLQGIRQFLRYRAWRISPACGPGSARQDLFPDRISSVLPYCLDDYGDTHNGKPNWLHGVLKFSEHKLAPIPPFNQ